MQDGVKCLRSLESGLRRNAKNNLRSAARQQIAQLSGAGIEPLQTRGISLGIIEAARRCRRLDALDVTPRHTGPSAVSFHASAAIRFAADASAGKIATTTVTADVKAANSRWRAGTDEIYVGGAAARTAAGGRRRMVVFTAAARRDYHRQSDGARPNYRSSAVTNAGNQIATLRDEALAFGRNCSCLVGVRLSHVA